MSRYRWMLTLLVLTALILSACQPVMPVETAETGSQPTEEVPTLPALPGEVLIPAGTFQMGCDEGNPAERCRDVELPLHTVYLDTYYIDQYEVTNARYKACVDAGACIAPAAPDSTTHDIYYGNPEYDEYPVVWMDWFQAEAFCAWEGKRLPTEAEWVKAARGPDDTRMYPWGNDAPTCELANYWEGTDGCVGDTLAVGTLLAGASPYGVMNMGGNVVEWVSDWYEDDYYSVSPAENPPGPSTGATKTQMGSSFRDPSSLADVTSRFGISPQKHSVGTGFRCAHSP